MDISKNSVNKKRKEVKDTSHFDQLENEILLILLKDQSRTSNKNQNIIWATQTYEKLGKIFKKNHPVTIEAITGQFKDIIKPRIYKSKKEQESRIKDKAEVFTPSWICNKQNNLVDNQWFNKENVFNFEIDKKWKTNYEKIVFPNLKNKTWQDYVKAIRLEIACGEAPYLVSRYDTVSGKKIKVKNRIGILDRKLRVVSENNNNELDWYKWVLLAFKATYGFDFQGDNVLLARQNLLFTFIEYYQDKFNQIPSQEMQLKISQIITWNIWQMDGTKLVIPNSCKKKPNRQMNLFDFEETEECEGCIKQLGYNHTGIKCKVMDWEKNQAVIFERLLGEKNNE